MMGASVSFVSIFVDHQKTIYGYYGCYFPIALLRKLRFEKVKTRAPVPVHLPLRTPSPWPSRPPRSRRG